MRTFRHLISPGLLLLTFTILLSCATREELLAKSGTNTVGVDLSGQWLLRDKDSDSMRRIDAAVARGAGGRRELIPPARSGDEQRSARQARGTLVYVFLETGRLVKITQTRAGLFISFDRAIVEEYRFGEKREINVGEITAQRVSGWEGSAYVVETLDKDGAKLTERYELRDDGSALARSIRIESRDASEAFSVTQLFDRAD